MAPVRLRFVNATVRAVLVVGLDSSSAIMVSLLLCIDVTEGAALALKEVASLWHILG